MSKLGYVLIVDDEPGIRGFIRAVLEDEGIEVREACDGPAALSIAAAECPRVVLLDQMMPGMTGIDTGVALRQLCGGSLPLVFMSAMPLDLTELQRVDAFLFLTKPFELDDLAEAVHSAASAHQPQPLIGRGIPEVSDDSPAACEQAV